MSNRERRLFADEFKREAVRLTETSGRTIAQVADGVLTVRGEKKQEEGMGFYRKERVFGSFRRALPIPGELDEAKIEASFKNGVLTVDLPKTGEAQKKVRHIDVKAA